MTYTEKEVAVYTLFEGSGKILVFLNSLDLIYSNFSIIFALFKQKGTFEKGQLAFRLNCQRPCSKS